VDHDGVARLGLGYGLFNACEALSGADVERGAGWLRMGEGGQQAEADKRGGEWKGHRARIGIAVRLGEAILRCHGHSIETRLFQDESSLARIWLTGGPNG
jgi:hypothetical protein